MEAQILEYLKEQKGTPKTAYAIGKALNFYDIQLTLDELVARKAIKELSVKNERPIYYIEL